MKSYNKCDECHFRRIPVPRHKKQRTYETAEKRIQNGKTRYMLGRVVSQTEVGISRIAYSVRLFLRKKGWNDNAGMRFCVSKYKIKALITKAAAAEIVIIYCIKSHTTSVLFLVRRR